MTCRDEFRERKVSERSNTEGTGRNMPKALGQNNTEGTCRTNFDERKVSGETNTEGRTGNFFRQNKLSNQFKGRGLGVEAPGKRRGPGPRQPKNSKNLNPKNHIAKKLFFFRAKKV